MQAIENDRIKSERESQLLWAEVSTEQAKLQRREADLEQRLASFEREKNVMLLEQ